MKSTGIVRKIDELGRITLPAELRKKLEIDTRDDIEIFIDDGAFILKKYTPTCIFCGSNDNLQYYKDRHVCRICINKLNNCTL